MTLWIYRSIFVPEVFNLLFPCDFNGQQSKPGDRLGVAEHGAEKPPAGLKCESSRELLLATKSDQFLDRGAPCRVAPFIP